MGDGFIDGCGGRHALWLSQDGDIYDEVGEDEVGLLVLLEVQMDLTEDSPD